MAELEKAEFGENIDVGVGGGGIDAKEVRLEVVNTDGVLVEVGLSVFPGAVQGQVIEDVGQAVVLEVEGPNGLAQAGGKGVEVSLSPGLKLGEPMVALGSDEGNPDTGDFAEGQFALPAVPGGEVAVEGLGHLQVFQRGQQDGDVVHPFHPMHVRGFGTHARFRMPRSLS